MYYILSYYTSIHCHTNGQKNDVEDKSTIIKLHIIKWLSALLFKWSIRSSFFTPEDEYLMKSSIVKEASTNALRVNDYNSQSRTIS